MATPAAANSCCFFPFFCGGGGGEKMTEMFSKIEKGGGGEVPVGTNILTQLLDQKQTFFKGGLSISFVIRMYVIKIGENIHIYSQRGLKVTCQLGGGGGGGGRQSLCGMVVCHGPCGAGRTRLTRRSTHPWVTVGGGGH